jgi:telomerase protein component 1
MLRSKLNAHLINLYEIDLRWGITEYDAQYNQTLDICLSQVLESDYFIGILGDRYGHYAATDHTNAYVCRKIPELAWLEHYQKGASITELEIQAQLNKKIESKYQRSFFYFRDNESLKKQIPSEYHDELWDNDQDSVVKLNNLKRKLKMTSYEIFHGYPCRWLTFDKTSNRVLLTGLEQFAMRVYNNLLNAIISEYGNATKLQELDLFEHWTELTNAYTHAVAETFFGRQRLIKKFEKVLEETQLHQTTHASTEAAISLANQHNSMTDLHLIIGEAGSGKTSFLSHFITENADSGLLFNKFTHFVGAFPGSENMTVFLKRLCVEISQRFGLDSDLSELKESNDYDYFKLKLKQLLEDLSTTVLHNEKFYVIVDGVDSLVDDLNNPNHSFDWLPLSPEGLISKIAFVFTARTSSPTKTALQRLANSISVSSKSNSALRVSLIEVEQLDILDKSEFVRQCLRKFGKYLEETPFNNQLKMLTGKRDATLPFYLTLACEELRMNAQFESLNAKLKELPLKVSQLLDYIVIKLEENHGREFVRAVFTFICCSRDGLTEQELDDMLHIYFKSEDLNLSDQIERTEMVFSLDTESILKKLTDAKSKRLTKLKYISFVDAIRNIFLSPNSQSLICLKKNESIENCLRSRYGPNSKTININASLAQKIMAIYYWHSIDTDFEKSWTSKNSRALTYLPYYLSKTNLFSDLVEVLTNFEFLAAKCYTNNQSGASELMDDFDTHTSANITNILLSGNNNSVSSTSSIKKFASTKQVQSGSKSTENPLQTKRFLEYKHFFTTNFHLILQSGDFIFQQAINQPSSSHTYTDLKRMLKNNPHAIDTNLFIWLNKVENQEEANIEPVTINDTESIISTVIISPSGQYVACGTNNCDVRLYSLATASLIRTFQGHSGEITALAFSGDGILCSASSDGKASIWNVNDGYRIKVLSKHNGHTVSGICTDGKSGKILVTVGWDCSIKLWSPSDGNNIGELRGLTKPINCVTFDPSNENMIATGSWDSCIRLFNLVDRTRKAVFRGHTSSIRAISYSHTGLYISSASMDGQVKLWNARNGLNVATLRGHSMPVHTLCFSPNSQYLVTGSVDRRVKVWTGSVGKMTNVIKNEPDSSVVDNEKVEPLTCVCINKHTGDSVAVGTQYGTIKIYNLKTSILMYSHKVHNASIKRVKYANYGDYIVSSAEDGTVKVLDLEKKRICAELVENTNSVNALSVNNKNLVVTGNEDGALHIYCNILDKKNAYIAKRPVYKLYEHKSPITACAFNVNGNQFASASKDATLIVWFFFNTNNEPVERFVVNSAHPDWITDLSWSAECLVTCSNDHKLKTWSVENSGELEKELSGHTSNLNACASSNGFVVSACSDGTMKMWSQQKATEITTLYGHQSRVNSCDLFVKGNLFEINFHFSCFFVCFI